MSKELLKSFGLTPWQAVSIIALSAFYLGEMRPKLGAIAEIDDSLKALNVMVHQLTTKVEIHAIMLAEISDVKKEIKSLQAELTALRFKNAGVQRQESKLPEQNELSPRRDLGNP